VVDFWPHSFARKSSFIVCSSPTRNPFAIKNPRLRTGFVKIASMLARLPGRAGAAASFLLLFAIRWLLTEEVASTGGAPSTTTNCGMRPCSWSASPVIQFL
jgi:hypothetical protein